MESWELSKAIADLLCRHGGEVNDELGESNVRVADRKSDQSAVAVLGIEAVNIIKINGEAFEVSVEKIPF